MSLVSQVSSLATRIGTEFKTLRATLGSNASLTTTDKATLVGAINEVATAVGSAGATINDTTPSTITVYSSTKTDAQISAATAALVASAPGALDTLDELAAALGDDANFAATTATSIGNRVRYDAAQSLTGPQQTQARANIGAGTSNLVIGTGAGTAAEGNDSRLSDARTPLTHTHTASQISDASAIGKTVLLAADAAAVRTAIGAGTSSVVIGTGSGQAADAALLATSLSGKAPTSHTHTASQISDASTSGRTVLLAADAAAVRTAIGAGTGTSNLVIGTTSGTAADAAVLATSLSGKANTSHTHTAANISDSSTIGRTILTAADAAAVRAATGAGTSNLVIGTTGGTAADAAVLATSLSGKSDVGHTHAGADVAIATTTTRGTIEIATNAEAATGTDATLAITPASLKSITDNYTTSANIGSTTTNFVTTFEAALV